MQNNSGTKQVLVLRKKATIRRKCNFEMVRFSFRDYVENIQFQLLSFHRKCKWNAINLDLTTKPYSPNLKCNETIRKLTIYVTKERNTSCPYFSLIESFKLFCILKDADISNDANFCEIWIGNDFSKFCVSWARYSYEMVQRCSRFW